MSDQMHARGPEFNPAMQADEPLTPFDVTQSSQSAGMIKLAVGFGLLLALAFIVFKIYNPDGTRDRGDPPLITAENTPFKVVPEDPGGLQTPDQDKEVFDIMSGGETNPNVVTRPEPEQPVQRSDPVTPNPVVTQPVIADPAPTPPATQRPAPQSPPTVPAETRTPEPVVQPAPARQPAATGSNWVVQIASLRSQGEAERTYAAIETRHNAVLRGYRSDIVRVDLAEKGIYYRARVAGFADRSAADRVCDQLKAAGQSCFVARR